MANESSESKDDVIMVDEVLATSTPVGPVEEAVGKAPVEEEKSASPPDAIDATPGPEVKNIDDLLATEDPVFSAAMLELQEQKNDESVVTVEIDSLDVAILVKEGEVDSDVSRFRRVVRYGSSLLYAPLEWGPVLLGFARQAWAMIKESLKRVGALVKQAMQSYGELPKSSKLLLWLAIVLGGLSVATLKLSFGGKVAFDLGPGFLRSFADIADAKFTYDANEAREDFMDPLHHPEYMVTMDRFVINLRRGGDARESNPMGLFAFYFEASNQECAVEMKDREGEVRDLLSRTLEQMSFEELITAAGKEKLKLVLRKSLNGLLTRGQVRRVFLKNIVLKE